jgi:hypothetical protein
LPWLSSFPNWIPKPAVHDQSNRDSMTYGKDSPVPWKVAELNFVHSFNLEMCMWPEVCGAHYNHYRLIVWSPITVLFSKYDSGYLSWARLALGICNVAYQFSLSLISL